MIQDSKKQLTLSLIFKNLIMFWVWSIDFNDANVLIGVDLQEYCPAVSAFHLSSDPEDEHGLC